MSFGKYWSLLLILFIANFGYAQTAEQIIEKYVKALGGQRALDQIKTLKYTRKFQHTESGKINRTTCYYRKPHWLRWEAGDSRRVWITIEKTQWRGKRDSTGGKIIWDKERNVRRKPFILKPWGDFLNRERELKFQYNGKEQIESKEAIHVTMISESGYKSELFFDSQSGLLIGTRSGSKQSRFGLMISKISDYRSIGKVLFPFKEEATRETADGKKFHQINTMINVEINIPLTNTLFQTQKTSNEKEPNGQM